jgi:hypothetical protein
MGQDSRDVAVSARAWVGLAWPGGRDAGLGVRDDEFARWSKRLGCGSGP